MVTSTDTMGTRLVTAYFEDRSEASHAVDRLVGLGIPQANVRLAGGETATTTTKTEEKGFWASLGDLFLPDEDRDTYAEGLRRGGYVVSARVDSAYYEQALDILDDEGTVDIAEREETWRSEGWSGNSGYTATETSASATPVTTAATAATGTLATGDAESIKVAEERLRVGKRDVNNGRVRVRSYVIEEPVSEEVTLRQERVDIERRTVDLPAGDADALFQERTIEVEEHAEEAVIAKDVRVTEEILVNKDITERTQEITDTVRKTKVEVEDERSAATTLATGTGTTKVIKP